MQFISTLNIYKEEEKSQQFIWVKEKIKFMRNDLTEVKTNLIRMRSKFRYVDETAGHWRIA